MTPALAQRTVNGTEIMCECSSEMSLIGKPLASDYRFIVDFRRLHRSTGWRRVARHAATAAYELPPPAATI
jgi:hypothetical protein